MHESDQVDPSIFPQLEGPMPRSGPLCDETGGERPQMDHSHALQPRFIPLYYLLLALRILSRRMRNGGSRPSVFPALGIESPIILLLRRLRVDHGRWRMPLD
jgi:hypothetical protein